MHDTWLEIKLGSVVALSWQCSTSNASAGRSVLLKSLRVKSRGKGQLFTTNNDAGLDVWCNPLVSVNKCQHRLVQATTTVLLVLDVPDVQVSVRCQHHIWSTPHLHPYAVNTEPPMQA
jgi:hypothetical protein